mgnify:CR=1 FL=1
MIYGDFIACFPELQERIDVWTKEDKSDIRTISVVYIPQEGSLIKRRKYTSSNTGLDITDADLLYVHFSYKEQISTGDYFYKDNKIIDFKEVKLWISLTESTLIALVRLQVTVSTTFAEILPAFILRLFPTPVTL